MWLRGVLSSQGAVKVVQRPGKVHKDCTRLACVISHVAVKVSSVPRVELRCSSMYSGRRLGGSVSVFSTV